MPDKSHPTRCFIAIDIPDAIKSKLSALQNSLKRLGASISWTRSEGIHLTLKFLGDVDQVAIPDVIKSMEAAVSDSGSFTVTVEGVGCFPSPHRARVLWVGLDGGEPLVALQKLVEDAMDPLGFPKEERRFHPHLTLGRVRNPHGVDRVVQEMQRSGFPKQEFTASGVRLMKSDLQPSGAVYTMLHSSRL